MSNEQSQGRGKPRKRDIFQAPFRQGLQWAERQLDELRSRLASPHPTRPSSPQATVTCTPSYPPQEISGSSSIQVPNVTPYPHSQESFGENTPQVVHYGPVYNIGTAGNVATGAIYGSVTMISDNDEFMLRLRDLLKVSFKADHMYYANSDEMTLRRCSCTPGTRIDILQGVTHWAIDVSPCGERVYWLSGQAGAGKTTISYTVARQFENLFIDGNSRVTLGGSFFCSRQFVETRSASAIIRTIVYHLALRSKPFRAALKEHGRFETVNHGPRSQLVGLLVEPWRQSAPEREAGNEPCYVIPIDALDELEGSGGVEFLSTLLDVVDEQDLSGLKFFVTSRSEPALVQRVEAFSNKQVCRLEQVPLEESSADIKVYLEANLAQCATREQIQQLTLDAAGLLIHAATVVEYVKGRDVEKKSLLQRLLSTSSSSARRPSRAATATLDNLYLRILTTSLVDPREGDDDEAFQDCLSILHTFLCTIERTSTSVAVDIFNASDGHGDALLDAGAANGVLHRLYAVLYSHGGQVMWFHKSFPDFLFDKRRSQKFFCNQEQHHRRLAGGCFDLMSKRLRFNIADIPTSYQLDCDNPMLSACIEANIPRALRYACGNWSAHLVLSAHEAPDRLTKNLNEFLELPILFWMEAMNLLGLRGRCQGMLRVAQRWSQNSKDPAELVGKLAEAAAFARYHCTSKAALSTPHLYLSSLATFPRRPAMVQNWRRQFAGIPGFVNAQGVDGSLVASIMVGKVTALAVSPDSATIAAALADMSIRIRDLSTGEEVMILKGHTGEVRAVAYSPDGTCLVSGSGDELLRVWDLSTGEAKVLAGHTSRVNAVAYSPDGTYIASGSDDGSVRVWDLSQGKEVMVFNAHASQVYAVAYSPGGTHIAFGSQDNSVRVWDLSTGEVMVIIGHTSRVTSVAYSPDGARVASGSLDYSLRVWNLSTAKEVQFFGGHSGQIESVAYSPDGTHVVSVTGSHAIQMWDLSKGEEVRAFRDHNSDTLVAYFPDGTHLVSASVNESVRVWDVSKGEEGVLQEDIGMIRAVAFSPDGTPVAFGSRDNLVVMWDLFTGEEVGFHGHTNTVSAFAYSPRGSHVVAGSGDGSIRIWDVSTRKQTLVFEGHTSNIYKVVFSPDGSRIVSSSSDDNLRVWDPSTGEEFGSLNISKVFAMAHSPDQNRVAYASPLDETVRIWDWSTDKEIMVFEGHFSICAVAYSPDGRHVAASSTDRSVHVWDLTTGVELMVLEGHTDWVRAVAYSPDGNHIVSGSDDQSVRLWDSSKQVEGRILMGHNHWAWKAAWSPDGTHVVSLSCSYRDPSARVWDISPEHRPRYVHQKGSDGCCTGWLLSPTNSSAHLMFVPPAAKLPDDSCVLTFPKSAVPHLEFSNARLGDRWAECYTSASF